MPLTPEDIDAFRTGLRLQVLELMLLRLAADVESLRTNLPTDQAVLRVSALLEEIAQLIEGPYLGRQDFSAPERALLQDELRDVVEKMKQRLRVMNGLPSRRAP